MLNAFLWNRKIKFNVKGRSFKKREQIVLRSNKRRNRNLKTKEKTLKEANGLWRSEHLALGLLESISTVL